MTYRCLIFDEERKLDARLRQLFAELARQISTLPIRVDETSDHQPGRAPSSTASRL